MLSLADDALSVTVVAPMRLGSDFFFLSSSKRCSAWSCRKRFRPAGWIVRVHFDPVLRVRVDFERCGKRTKLLRRGRVCIIVVGELDRPSPPLWLVVVVFLVKDDCEVLSRLRRSGSNSTCGVSVELVGQGALELEHVVGLDLGADSLVQPRATAGGHSGRCPA